MSGTKESGLAAARTNKAKYGENFYHDIGVKGAIAYMAKPKEERLPRGFEKDRELARRAGEIGGRASRRTHG